MHTIDLQNLSWRASLHGDAPADSPVASERLRDLAAMVPGTIHDVLLDARIISDPLLGTDEAASAWVSDADWVYETEFTVPAASDAPRWQLEFDGLQTMAEVRVNGTAVASTENMHRRYALDVTSLVHQGENTLQVVFRSTVAEMNARAAADGIDYPFDWAHPYNRVRTMASSVGWDWGPTLVSAGLWRGGRLRELTSSSFDAEIHTRLSPDLGTGTVVLDLTSYAEAGETTELVVTLGAREWTRSVAGGRSRIELEVDVEAQDIWWPRDLGAPVRHEVTVRTATGDGDTVTRHVGFRRADVTTETDAFGREFTIVINGRPIFVRGANWIPDDVFASRLTRDRYRTRIEAAMDANIHLLRVWGGGVYEGDDFYDLCDEHGMLVWQDFMFACAAYPETPEMVAEITAEAIDVVSRIAQHPSVVMWNGSNETELGWHGWGWQERLGGAAWGEKYYREVLPKALQAHDVDALYIPSSPTSLTPGVAPNVPQDGTAHLWNPWNRQDYAHYRDSIPRFVAEFGWQAPANWSTLAAAIGDDQVRPDSPALLAHQKQPTGMHNLRERLRTRFPDVEKIEQHPHLWHFATQLNQADAIRVAIEHFRSWWPRTAGSIIWQLNDTWPALSWSVLDYAGGRKLGWYAIRRAYADRLVTIQPREAGLSLLVVNDTDTEWSGSATVRRIGLGGGVAASRQIPFTIGARSVGTIALPHDVALPGTERREVLVADIDGDPVDAAPRPIESRAVHTFVNDEHVYWPVPEHDVSVTSHEDAGRYVTEVSITARSVLIGLSVLADKLDGSAVADSALVTLLPGETHRFVITSDHPLDTDRIAEAPVLMSRNELYR
nr:sugar-binding domain-containing protein [uncultured Microbacterium sp.]